MDDISFFGRHVKVTLFVETMLEVLGFNFVEIALLKLLPYNSYSPGNKAQSLSTPFLRFCDISEG